MARKHTHTYTHTMLLISHPAAGRRLSWPEWLVTYQDTANGHLSQY